MKVTILFLAMQLLFQASTLAQPQISTEESSTIKNQIEGFYSWYLDLIKNKRLNEDFNPSFVKKDDGMTTLDFTNYRKGLKRFNFSADFIQTKVNDYQDCVYKLSKVPFSKFSESQDLDDFESVNCAFRNIYEWYGSMEPLGSAELLRITRPNKKRILATVSFDPTGMALVTFKKIGDEWKIDNLTIELDTNE